MAVAWESIPNEQTLERPTGACGGADMHALIARLQPLGRSLTGHGVRQTLAVLQQRLPIEIHEVPSGFCAYDWIVPREWTLRDAWIKDARGNKIVDLADSYLHVVGYSVPVRAKLSLEELRPRLFTLPSRPSWIPYRTSYYREDWGFCLRHDLLEALPAGDYEVCIDSTLAAGSMTYGELFVPGQTSDEVLVSCHVCHPTLCNDNLSGLAVAMALAQWLAERPRRYSYRFLFAPGTLGAIVWLSRNEAAQARIKHGLVLTLLGDGGISHYKRSMRGDAEIDHAVEHVLRHSGADYRVLNFDPFGYDERQFNSPGINLPVGCFMRTPHGQFPEYHTSADDLTLVRPEHLADSLAKVRQVVEVLEGNLIYERTEPRCEPQLARHGLPSAWQADPALAQRAATWLLNQADARRPLLAIAERAGLPFFALARAAQILVERNVLRPAAAAEINKQSHYDSHHA